VNQTTTREKNVKNKKKEKERGGKKGESKWPGKASPSKKTVEKMGDALKKGKKKKRFSQTHGWGKISFP